MKLNRVPSRRPVRPLPWLLAVCAPLALDLHAQALEKVEVQGRAVLGSAESASQGEVGAERLATKPLLRPAELLEAMPGMIVTQHSGDGKANQYFLRGFNLDHGSDFATMLSGMPVNMASHAHGQGYMDLNFLMPELVDSLRYRKGAFAAEDGDFATTGASRIAYVRELARPFAELGLGPHHFRRALLAGSQPLAGGQALAALEASRNDGPWDQPEGLQRRNAVLRWSRGDEREGLSVSLMGYTARWKASEHVPLRAIESGEIGRYGTLSPDDGGITHRHSLSLDWATRWGSWQQQATAYVIDYGLQLYSAPSGFINGPDGDQHEQLDRRKVLGLAWQAQQPRLALWQDLAPAQLSWGLQWRQDRIATLGLYDTVERVRQHTVREDSVRQDALGLFAELQQALTPAWRAVLGARWDRVQADVQALGGEFNAGNGGRASDSRLSPRLGLVHRWNAETELYAHWGRGFRSNDARGATSRFNPQDGSAQDPLPLLAGTRSQELGLRHRFGPGWQASWSLWQADLDSELVFVGDEGVTEARGASRRMGLEWSNDIRLGRDWLIDADIAWSRARFVQAENGGRHVPNAIPLSTSVSASYDPGGAWSAGLRLRYIGRYALEESGSERSGGAFTVNAKLAWRPAPGWELGLDLLNALNTKAHDIEYWGNACTRREGAACGGGEGLPGRLVHPMEPRSLRFSVRVKL